LKFSKLFKRSSHTTIAINHLPKFLKQNEGKKIPCMFSLLKSWLSTLHTIWRPSSSKTVAVVSWKRFFRDRHYRIINWRKRHMEMDGHSRVV